MVERYLCLMLSGKVHGIELSKLLPNEDKNDGEDENEDEYEYHEEENDGEDENEDEYEYHGYGKPPPPPLPPLSSFDFTIDLPAWDMQVFSMDSKIYLVGGSDDVDKPCYEIYEFQCDMAGAGGEGGDDNNKKVQLNLLESIPEAPVYIDRNNSYIACISNEAYFLACNHGEYSFWVLRGCNDRGEWERLPLNTFLETQDSFGETYFYERSLYFYFRSKWFYSDNRLFLPCWDESKKMPSPYDSYGKPELILSCFDLQSRQWTMEEIETYRNQSMKSFNICLYNNHIPEVFPRLTVSSVTGLEDYPNYSVMLGYSKEHGFNTAMTPKIYAMLANQDGICVYQRIRNRVLLKGIKPYFRVIKEVFFVDVGEGKTCAMIFGFAQQDSTQKTKNIVLCVSIFTLALKDDDDEEFDVTAYESVNGDERRFLAVRVLSSHVYTIKENLVNMWPPFQKRREALDCDVDIHKVFVSPPP
ncbi:hypothetical protein PIB30_019768 [Stylosanthes scabra]|uniref:F-box protein n=1 Tax=Stylosanthes scabra TaxID=79078 RepID=A0ABU6X698_9FABA|nr:hypothetical protein [Stylosanthes scabra]